MIEQTPLGFWIIQSDSHISKWCLENKRLDHDLSLLPILLEYIETGDVIVDAGAYIGDHTIAYLNRVGPIGTVYAFEPNPEAFECLTRNCPSAKAYRMGLSDVNELLGASIVANENVGASYLTKGHGTAVRTLDSFNLPRLNFFKLDIEGMEPLAIQGAKKTIARCKPVICAEINVGALARNGFSANYLISKITDMGYTPKKVYDSDDWTSPQCDILFLPT